MSFYWETTTDIFKFNVNAIDMTSSFKINSYKVNHLIKSSPKRKKQWDREVRSSPKVGNTC